MVLEPTGCNSKKGIAYNFDSAGDVEAVSSGVSWW